MVKKLDLSKINSVPLENNQFVKEATTKTQIYLHHTAGNSSGFNVIYGWNKDKRGRVGTCVTISGKNAYKSKDGEICQAFSSRYWAYHLGAETKSFKQFGLAYKNLDKLSIGIEICNWGFLTKKDGKYYNYVNGLIDENEVTILDKPYRGKKYFHRYTDAQIESVRQLLVFWRDRYDIDITYNSDDMWELSGNALKGANGLFSHNSVRTDKIDIYPCPRMITMLKYANL